MKPDYLRDLVLHQDLLQAVDSADRALDALNKKHRQLTSVICLYDGVFAGCMLFHGSMLGYLIQRGTVPVLAFALNCMLISGVLWRVLIARNQRLEVNRFIHELTTVANEGRAHIDAVGVKADELESQIDQQLDTRRSANWS